MPVRSSKSKNRSSRKSSRKSSRRASRRASRRSSRRSSSKNSPQSQLQPSQVSTIKANYNTSIDKIDLLHVKKSDIEKEKNEIEELVNHYEGIRNPMHKEYYLIHTLGINDIDILYDALNNYYEQETQVDKEISNAKQELDKIHQTLLLLVMNRKINIDIVSIKGMTHGIIA